MCEWADKRTCHLSNKSRAWCPGGGFRSYLIRGVRTIRKVNGSLTGSQVQRVWDSHKDLDQRSWQKKGGGPFRPLPAHVGLMVNIRLICMERP